MVWQVSFYNNKVRKETLGLPAGILANLIRIIDLIEEFGPNLGLPHTAPMGNGLFEIRAKGPEGIGRSFFCIVKEEQVVILHTIQKKTQKTPKGALTVARKRMKDIKS